MTECKVCGRDEAGLEEIGYEPKFKEHQGILKCAKCIEEFEKESHTGQTEDNEESSQPQTSKESTGTVRKGTDDWKDKLGYA